MFRNRIVVLPHDIVLEILKKLPAKYLMRYKCVSKGWRNMISDSTFQEAHQDNSICRAEATHMLFACIETCLIMLYDCQYPHLVYVISPYQTEVHITNKPFPSTSLSCLNATKFQTPSNISKGHMVLFISDAFDFGHQEAPALIFINLSTFSRKALPVMEHISSTSSFSLGFDESSKMFKLVHYNRNSSQKCHILSIGSPEWRNLLHPSADFDIGNADCSCINGRLYYKKGRRDVQAVAFFDLQEERLQQQSVPASSIHQHGPTGWFENPYYFQEIINLKGKVGLLRGLKVWILEQYGWDAKDIILPDEVVNGEFAGEECDGNIFIKSFEAADGQSKYYLYNLETYQCKEATSISVNGRRFSDYVSRLGIPTGRCTFKLLNYVENIVEY